MIVFLRRHRTFWCDYIPEPPKFTQINLHFLNMPDFISTFLKCQKLSYTLYKPKPKSINFQMFQISMMGCALISCSRFFCSGSGDTCILSKLMFELHISYIYIYRMVYGKGDMMFLKLAKPLGSVPSLTPSWIFTCRSWGEGLFMHAWGKAWGQV